MNDSEIFAFLNDEVLAIQYCLANGLILNSKQCCSKELNIAERKTGKNKGFYFRCNSRLCRKEYSIRKNSFFEKSHLRIGQILTLMYYFVMRESSLVSLKRKTGIKSDNTIVDWLQFCREICAGYFMNHPRRIGGVGSVVEIDEALLVKRKYNRGRSVREQWIFMMYDVQLKEGVVVPVTNRSREVIIPIIQNYVLPGTTIYSDSALVYNNLSSLGYRHFSVNHSIGEWINTETGCTTNHVESAWQKVKTFNKVRYGTHRTTLESHMAEYMWLQKFGSDFAMFLVHLKELYKP